MPQLLNQLEIDTCIEKPILQLNKKIEFHCIITLSNYYYFIEMANLTTSVETSFFFHI